MKETLKASAAAQQGFTIIESMMAALFFFVVALVVCQMFTIHSQLFLLNESQRSAEAQVEQIVNQLAAQQRDSFASGARGMDQIVAPIPGSPSNVALLSGCAAWPCTFAGWGPVPRGLDALFARQWTINSFDVPRNLASVTVSVSKNTRSTEPLVRRTTNVVPQ